MTDDVPAEFHVTLPPNPYPGLRPFNGDEWPIFFGRERMADEVVSRLVREQFLVVHGDSGCGKSSLIRAGVLPRLEQENARGGLSWRTTVTQPRNAPLQLMAEALATLDGRDGDEARIIEIRRILNFGADAPPALAALLRRGPIDHICVLIDQFEELFAFARHSNAAEARLFVDILVALLEQPPQGLYAVVTMRSEFLGACAHFPGLAEAVNRAQYLLPRMGHADLLRAVREPASLYEGTIAPDLAERLIADSGGSQDQLPLIQHGLMQLTRNGRMRVALADYLAGGNLSESLSHHADQILASVETAPFPIAERLFRALTEINADGQAIRRPRTVAQLAAVCDTDAATIVRIANAFREEGASLLTPFGSRPIGERTLIDISHEALIRCWSRIAGPTGWLATEFQDGLKWRALLVQADDFASDPEHVLALATAEDQERWLTLHSPAWAERYGGGWDRVRRLIDASLATGRAEQREKEAAATRKRRYLTSFGAFLVVVAAALAWLYGTTRAALATANRASATSLWNRLDFTNPDRLQDDELNALWEIARSGNAVKSAFFDQLLTNHDRSQRLSRKPAPVLHAMFMEWPDDKRQALREAILDDGALTTADAAMLEGIAPAIPAIASAMTPVQAGTALDRYLSVLAGRSNGEVLTAVSSALIALAGRLASDAVAPALDRTIKALTTTPDGFYASAFTGLARTLASRLPESERDAILGSLLSTIATTTSANAIVNLAPVAEQLAAHLSAAQRDPRVIQVLARLAQQPSAPEQVALGTVGLALLREPGGRGELLLRPDAQALTKTTDAGIAQLLGMLVDQASTPVAAKVASAQVGVLATSRPGDRVFGPATVVAHAIARIENAERGRAIDVLVGVLSRSTNFQDAIALADGLEAAARTPDAMTDAQRKQTVRAFIVAAHFADQDSVAVFGKVAALVVEPLTSAEASAHLRTLIPDIARTDSTAKARALASLIAPLSTRLSSSDATALLPDVWGRIRTTIVADSLAGLGRVVPALAPRLEPPAVVEAMMACMRHLKAVKDLDQVAALSHAAVALAARLPAGEGARYVGGISEKINETTEPDLVTRYAIAIPSFASLLHEDQADTMLHAVLASVASHTYVEDGAFLLPAALALVPRVAQSRLPQFITITAKEFHGTLDEARISTLAAVLDALAERAQPGNATLLQTLVAWSPTPIHARLSIAQLGDRLARSSADKAMRIGDLALTLPYPIVADDLELQVLNAARTIDGGAPLLVAGDVPAAILEGRAWLSEHYPATNLTIPPACPAPLVPTLSCPTSTASPYFSFGSRRGTAP